MSAFQKAVRQKVFLKIALQGPSGSGKTYSALRLAFGIGAKVAFVDTENGSGSLYAGINKDGIAEYDVMTLEPPFHPKKYIDGIQDAEKAGYEVLIIDSFSHAWREILEMKGRFDSQGGNQFTNWGKVKPLSESLKQAILQSKMHVICCMRAKDEYALEQDEKGKQSVKKLGMGPIQEPGVEYEFTTVFDIGMDHSAGTSKDRTGLFADEVAKITPGHGTRLLQWLGTAADVPASTPPVDQPRVSTADRVQQHMQANGQTGPLNPEPPVSTAAEFKRVAIERGFTDKVKLETIQAWIEALAPDYAGRPYKQFHGKDWAYLITQMPASATPYSSGAEDPFEDTPEEIAADKAREAVAA